MSEEQKPIPLEQLTPQQLLQIKKQLEEEVTQLTNSLSQFRIANSKYEESKNILKKMEKTPDGTEVLIPITTSLYVPGKLIKPENVTIDYGTGYYVERNCQQAYHLCDRKLALLKESQDKLANIVNQKRQFIEKITLELQKRVMQVQQLQGQTQQQKK